MQVDRSARTANGASAAIASSESGPLLAYVSATSPRASTAAAFASPNTPAQRFGAKRCADDHVHRCVSNETPLYAPLNGRATSTYATSSSPSAELDAYSSSGVG